MVESETSTPLSWYDLPSGMAGVSYETSFSRHGLRVLLVFNTPDASLNLGRFEAFYAMKEKFEDALGGPATWDEQSGNKGALVYARSPFDSVIDVDQWPAMLDWVIDHHVRFRQAVNAIGGLASLPTA